MGLISRVSSRTYRLNMMKLLGILPFLSISQAMYFKLEAGSEKCLKEEVHKDILVTGNYQVEDKPNIDVDIKITDSKAHILFQKEEASEGKFAFTLDTADVFSVCFNAKTKGAKKGEFVEEDLRESIVNDFALMKKREEEMRDTNESTNSRVL